jgi:GH15 family glucan-1,4-alpha-glucosidase
MTSVDTQAESSLADLAQLARQSSDLIVSLQDPSGAYPASPTFSAYRGFCWFRDGAYIADGVSSMGEVQSASAFFDWCARILESRAQQIDGIVAAAAAGSPVADADMLPTRFTFDGRDGDDEWWDYQLDGYGTWLWAVVEHAERHNLSLDRWSRAISLSVEYLRSSWMRPCFDWWEENAAEVHGSTLGCIAGGFIAVDRAGLASLTDEIAAIRTLMLERGTHDGRLAKWLGSPAIDASLASVVYPLGVFAPDTAVGAATIAAIESDLTHENGVHRYLDDTFFGGGQWPLLSCMLGIAHTGAGSTDRALELLRWAAANFTAEGYLPEQVDHHLLDASMTREWVDRWGTVATPLLWSHAMFARLAVELGVAK